MNDWISVEERLPEEEMIEVLVWPQLWRYPTAIYGEGTFVMDGRTLKLVTHWMPLPAGPEKNK